MQTETGQDVLEIEVVVEPGPFSTQLFPTSPRPEDTDERADTYPSEVGQTFEALANAFQAMFEDPDTPTDPQLVVDRIIELINMSPGTRPFRSVVGVDIGVGDRNTAVEPFDQAALAAFGMSEFATLGTKTAE